MIITYFHPLVFNQFNQFLPTHLYHNLNFFLFFGLMYQFPIISVNFLDNVLILIQWNFCLNNFMSFLINVDQFSCNRLFLFVSCLYWFCISFQLCGIGTLIVLYFSYGSFFLSLSLSWGLILIFINVCHFKGKCFCPFYQWCSHFVTTLSAKIIFCKKNHL